MRSRLAWVLALTACRPVAPDGATLVVPAAELHEAGIDEADLDEPEPRLVVPIEDLAAHPGPRPRARLAVPVADGSRRRSAASIRRSE